MIIRARGTAQQPQSIRIGGSTITEETTHKVLGMTLNNRLTWNDHVYGLISSLNSKIGGLKRLSYHVPAPYMIPIARATIVAKLRYGLGIYRAVRSTEHDSHCTMMNDLQVVLNNAMRLILNKRLSDRMRVEDLCNESGFESINRMTAEEQIRIVWNARDNPNSPVLELFDRVSGGSTRANTRGDLTTSARTSLATQNLPHRAILTWNSTNEALREAKNRRELRTHTQQFIKLLPIR